MKKIIALISLLVIAFLFVGCFFYTPVEADMERIEIEVIGFDNGISEIVITNDMIEEYQSIRVNAKAIWKDTIGDYTVAWSFVGDDLGCKVNVIDPCCTGGMFAYVDFNNKVGKITLRATAISKNEIYADLIIWIGQESQAHNTVSFSVGKIENKMSPWHYNNVATIIDSAFSCERESDFENSFDFWLDYDEAFFAEKALVVHILNTGTTGGVLEVEQLVRQDRKLIMDIYFQAGDSDALSYWMVVLEVNKADIAGIDEVTVKDFEVHLMEANGHFFMTGFGGGLINLPYDLYGNYIPSIFHGDTRIITIYDEEQAGAFSETYSQSWSQEENCWIRDNRFSDLIDDYNENLFQDKQIITFFVEAAGGGYHFELSKVIYNNGVLTINIDQVSEGIGHCAIVNWFGIVEVEKIPADTKIVIKVNNRG